MKLIGKQIVVELPENPHEDVAFKRVYASALSEVARMNPAWEVDVKKMLKCFRDFNFEYFKTYRDSPPADVLINALASNPSAWMKRKDSDDKEKV